MNVSVPDLKLLPPVHQFTARTPEGKEEIRKLVMSARRHGRIHVSRPTKEAQPPRVKGAYKQR